MRFNLSLLLGIMGVLPARSKDPDDSDELRTALMKLEMAYVEIASLKLEIVHLKEELDECTQGSTSSSDLPSAEQVCVAGVDHGVVEQVKPSTTLTPEQAAADAFGRNTGDFKARALDTGADLISDELLARFERLVIGRGGGDRLHRLFRRGSVLSHRDFDKMLTSMEQRKPAYLLHSCRGNAFGELCTTADCEVYAGCTWPSSGDPAS